MLNKAIAILILFLLCTMCRKPVPEAKPQIPEQFNDGFFVLCEGTYGSGNAAISYVNTVNHTSISDLFKPINGRTLGDQAQYAVIHNDLLFIAVQNSGTIEVVQRADFKSRATITAPVASNLPPKSLSPRHIFFTTQNKGYVADWASDGVYVLDIAKQALVKHIPLSADPEFVLQVGSLVWVGCAGYSSTQHFNNTIHVLDPNTDQVQARIQTEARPMYACIDKQGYVWVLCRGFLSYNSNGEPDIYTAKPATIQKIDPTTFEVLKSYRIASEGNVSQTADFLIYNPNRNALMYAYSGSLYELGLNDSLPTSQAIIKRNFYGLNFDPTQSYLYGCYAPNFTSDGRVIRYKLLNYNWVPLDSFVVGVNPNKIILAQ